MKTIPRPRGALAVGDFVEVVRPTDQLFRALARALDGLGRTEAAARLLADWELAFDHLMAVNVALWGRFVRTAGVEPATSAVSRQRSTTELRAQSRVKSRVSGQAKKKKTKGSK